MAYNYDKFDSAQYDLTTFRGPAPGTKAPDFTLTLPDGTPARLLDFDTPFLVLETGSVTCPLFQGRRKAMERLDTTISDASFTVLYVREAHPGATIGAHTSQQGKTANAQILVGADGEKRRVLVDDLQGHAHQAYGAYPNAVFIINRNGCVLWMSDWNNAAATARALEDLRAGRPARQRAYFKPVVPATSVRVLSHAGRGALWDFLRSLPSLIWHNLILRNIRLLRGKTASVPPDAAC